MTNISKEKLRDLIKQISLKAKLDPEGILNAIECAMESGQLNADDWISVDEDVPDFKVDVLAQLVSAKGNKRFAVAHRRDREDAEWFIEACEVSFNWDVIRWQPIDPPGEK